MVYDIRFICHDLTMIIDTVKIENLRVIADKILEICRAVLANQFNHPISHMTPKGVPPDEILHDET